jgi:hypothetical protein
LIAAAMADPEIEGLLLGGSRGAGVDDADSDYDLIWVLADQAYDWRAERGESLHIKQDPGQPLLDVSFTCLRELARIAARVSWELPGYATAQ